ncbi:MAG: hypothetical protein JKY17_08875 [Magnetovibrio sp.]|nr:hypothetical protein [Magnetovibrio sp.]
MSLNPIFVPRWIGGSVARLGKTEPGARAVTWNAKSARWGLTPKRCFIDVAAVLDVQGVFRERLGERVAFIRILMLRHRASGDMAC